MEWRNVLSIAGIAERRGFKLHLRRRARSAPTVEQQVAFEFNKSRSRNRCICSKCLMVIKRVVDNDADRENSGPNYSRASANAAERSANSAISGCSAVQSALLIAHTAACVRFATPIFRRIALT